jgi:hypothetical protein
MAMETHVFFRGKLPSKAALSRALKELGFPLAVKPATGSLEQQAGFMPMMIWHEETGAEFDAYTGDDALADFAEVGADPRFDRRASFRWGGDAHECAAGTCGAAALAKLVGGVVFDEQENRLLSVDDAIAVARKYLATLPRPKKVRRPYSPAGIKRMLAPLLAKRSDLALVDRMLLIRPVRHFVRGVRLQWIHKGQTVLALPYFRPLYGPYDLLDFEQAAFSGYVYHENFEPMFFAHVAEKVFAPLGKIATIEDFIETMGRERQDAEDLYPSIVLSAGIERASEYLAQFERSPDQTAGWVKAGRALVDRGSDAVFEWYRAAEAWVARRMKIEEVWEPTPFPAELPQRERGRSADPLFAPTPWLDFPSDWRIEAPTQPGDVRFGEECELRDGRVMLLHPRTRKQAEEVCGKRLWYLLMTRLPEGQVLVLDQHGTIWEGEAKPPVTQKVRVYGSGGRHLIADFREDRDNLGTLKLWTIELRGSDSGFMHFDFEKNEKSIHAYRAGGKSYERRPMTAADRSFYAFPVPPFGEFEILWDRVSTCLRTEGFGPLR